MIEPDDIVITDITETNSGLSVTFYVRGQAGAPIDANDVVEAVKASFYRMRRELYVALPKFLTIILVVNYDSRTGACRL